MSINAEVIGGTPMVQHYVKQVADGRHLVLDSVCNPVTQNRICLLTQRAQNRHDFLRPGNSRSSFQKRFVLASDRCANSKAEEFAPTSAAPPVALDAISGLPPTWKKVIRTCNGLCSPVERPILNPRNADHTSSERTTVSLVVPRVSPESIPDLRVIQFVPLSFGSEWTLTATEHWHCGPHWPRESAPFNYRH
jgi:hypothetical protein